MLGFVPQYHLGFLCCPEGTPDSWLAYFRCWLIGRHRIVMHYDSSGHCQRCGVRF